MTGIPAVLAVDLGGTTMRGAVVEADGHVAHREAVPTPKGAGDRIVIALAELLARLRERAKSTGIPVAAAGIVTPGIIDENGVVEYASNLGWRDVPLARILREQLGIPVAVGHDVRAAADAERLLGRAVGVRDFVHVAIGTGVAAGLYDAGVPVLGAARWSGEIGHIPVLPDGERCTCGQRGCLEVYMSGAGLARRYLALTGTSLTAEELTSRIGTDAAADSVWTDGVRALSLGLATVTLLLDPELVVLGGGVAGAGDALTRPVRATTTRLLAWRNPPRIELSTLGGEAGRVGASALAFRAAGLAHVVEAWARDDVGDARTRGMSPRPA